MSAELLTFEDVAREIRAKGCCHGAVNPDVYHAMKKELAREFGCPVVSKSALADFEESRLRYRWNELHGEKKTSAALLFGSLVDCLVLTPDEFPKLYVSERIDGRTKEGKARKKELEEKGLTNIDPEDLTKAEYCRDQVNRHLREAYKLELGKGFRSQVGMWAYLDSIGGVRLACPVILTGMIDILPDADTKCGSGIIDLKTTSADVEDAEKLCYNIEDYRYGLQAAIYLDLWTLCTGEVRTMFAFLFVSSVMPAVSRMMLMPEAYITPQRRRYEALLRAFAYAWKENDWGEPTQPQTIYTPTSNEATRMQRWMLGKEEQGV